MELTILMTPRRLLLRILLIIVPFWFSMPITPAIAATQFEIFPTYRQDNFLWNKAGLNDFPNVLSELKWENLRIQGIKGVLKHDMGKRHFIEASGGWGWIYSGTNQDSDYDGDNRTDEYSRSNNTSDHGNVFDLSLALGWKLQDKPTQRTSLLAGYAINSQNLTMTNGVQTIPATGPFPGLNAAYKGLWRGPWLGLSHEQQLNKKWALTTRVEYHLPNYNGEAHWNLRNDLAHPVTNNHWANGQGLVASLGVDYKAGPSWRIGAWVDYTHYLAKNGTDQVNVFDGSHIQIRLNEVRWDSWAFRLRATYLF